MTDPELLAKKLAEIETYVRELQVLADPDRLGSDVKEERFIAHTLQLAIQTALDVGSHIVSDERLGEPRTNREIFVLLDRAGWISPDLATRLRDMAGFRNVLVHAYSQVDHSIVREIVTERLSDLTAYVAVIRGRLPADQVGG
ncbi:DUF86 domain-containing protein [soil metagenome]